MNPDQPIEISSALQENSAKIGPGQRLTRARLAYGLSVNDVAHQLNLSPTLIEMIENDSYREAKSLPDIVFLKGYVKSYARVLDVSADEVMKAFAQLNLEDAPRHTFTPLVPKHFQKRSYVSDWHFPWVSTLTIAGLVVLGGLWWQAERSQAIDSSLEHAIATGTKAIDSIEKQSESLKGTHKPSGVTAILPPGTKLNVSPPQNLPVPTSVQQNNGVSISLPNHLGGTSSAPMITVQPEGQPVSTPNGASSASPATSNTSSSPTYYPSGSNASQPNNSVAAPTQSSALPDASANSQTNATPMALPKKYKSKYEKKRSKHHLQAPFS